MTSAEAPTRRESSAAQGALLLQAVVEAQRWITSIYRLDLDLRAEQFVVDPGTALRLLPPDSPRSGLVVVEEPAEISVGIYIDAADVDDPWTVIEETSHLLYLAWLADRDWSVSRLVLEFQSEVDRYAVGWHASEASRGATGWTRPAASATRSRTGARAHTVDRWSDAIRAAPTLRRCSRSCASSTASPPIKN
jgi:hypothetical protein